MPRKLGIFHPAAWIVPQATIYTDEILPDVEIVTITDDSLSREFIATRKLSPYIISRFCRYMQLLREAGCDVVMTGCSTLSPCVDYARPLLDCPVLRIDEPMARLAVAKRGRVAVLGTLESTMPSSVGLVRRIADEMGRDITITERVVRPAFDAWRVGEIKTHNRLCLEAMRELQESVDVIECAQISMSCLDEDIQAADWLRVPVYTSGRTGFRAAREVIMSL